MTITDEFLMRPRNMPSAVHENEQHANRERQEENADPLPRRQGPRRWFSFPSAKHTGPFGCGKQDSYAVGSDGDDSKTIGWYEPSHQWRNQTNNQNYARRRCGKLARPGAERVITGHEA